MHSTDQDWAKSYARQALSDLNARETLVAAKVEKCHRLHFLQMAAEKACKAHLMKTVGHDKVRKRHAYVKKTLPTMARQFYALSNANRKPARRQFQEIKHLAGEIEVLAPACDGDDRRDNSEYPWEDGKGNICTPCDYNFPNIDDGSRAIIPLIKLIREACESYAR